MTSSHLKQHVHVMAFRFVTNFKMVLQMKSELTHASSASEALVSKELRPRGLRTGSAVSSVLSGRREKAALNDRNSVDGDSRCHSPH